MSRFFGGRYFGGRFFGGRYFGGTSTSAPAVATNPQPVFGWPIYSDRGVSYTPTFSGGSWQSTLPLTNLADRRLSRLTRSTDALTTSTTFDVDLQVARSVGVLALPKHSLSSNAFVRWRGSNSAGVFTSPVYDSGLIAAWPAGSTAEDLDGLNVSHVHLPTDVQSARYWRCDITDTSNPAGSIDLARVVIAGRWTPTQGMSSGAKIGLETATERVVTDGGAALYRPKPVRRYWDFTIAMLEETEAYAKAWLMQRQLGQHGQMFFVFDQNDPSFMHERAFLCVIRELSPIEYPFANYNSVAFRLLEEL